MNLLDMLIKAGADVNMKQECGTDSIYDNWAIQLPEYCMIGRTALMLAANKGNVICTQLLLNARADVNIVHLAGENEFLKSLNYGAVNYAVFSKSKGVLGLLIDAGADVNSCYFNLPDVNLKMFHQLLCAGIKVNQPDRYGENALDYCIHRYGNTDRTKDEPKLFKQKIKLLHAAGETLSTRSSPLGPGLLESITPQLKYETDVLNLMRICRKFARKNLLQMSQVNLFYRVPRLGLPAALCKYLLYNISLDADNTDDDDF